jgi:hypothetical protein
MSNEIESILSHLQPIERQTLLEKAKGDMDRALNMYFDDPVNSIKRPLPKISHTPNDNCDIHRLPNDDVHCGTFLTYAIIVSNDINRLGENERLQVYKADNSTPLPKKRKKLSVTQNQIVRLKSSAGDVAKFDSTTSSFISKLMDLGIVYFVYSNYSVVLMLLSLKDRRAL